MSQNNSPRYIFTFVLPVLCLSGLIIHQIDTEKHSEEVAHDTLVANHLQPAQNDLSKSKSTLIVDYTQQNQTTTGDAKEKLDQQIFDLETFNKMIYSGNEDSIRMALDNCLEFKHHAIPAILFIVNSNHSLTIKEFALLQMSKLNQEVVAPIFSNLLANAEVESFIYSLGYDTIELDSYVSPYHQQLSFLPDNTLSNKDLMLSSDPKLRLQIIEEAFLLPSDMATNLLEAVIKLDNSVDVQKYAFAQSMLQFPELRQKWLTAALTNPNEALTSVALDEMLDNADNDPSFISGLGQVLFAENPPELKSKAAQLLSYYSNPAALNLLTRYNNTLY